MRLLLVEDDHRVVRFVQKGLEAERYEVDVATDGEQAIEMGLTGVYDLVLLDLILPVKSGIEVCQVLRERGIQSPILMLTAKDTLDDKVTGLEVGADDYLTKPFAFEELLARIKALLRRPGGLEDAPTLMVADLVLDKRTHQVTRAGRPIELTAKEHGLLECLMRNPNRLLDRATIEERVWGQEHGSDSNVVNVYIGRLRKKVDEGFDKQLIHTIRGAGYMLKL